MTSFTLRIYRGSPAHQHWEDFNLECLPRENVISALMRIRKNPINAQGKRVDPIVWEDGCLEQVCGSCSMLIDSTPRQACAALIEKLLKGKKERIIELAPLSKFPLVRDLMVDRSQMFDNLKQIQAWVEVDDYKDPGASSICDQKIEELRYSLSTCMTCGCCSEACPQVHAHSPFMGPATMAQAWLFDLHPMIADVRRERRRILMKEGGISGCGNAQNCVRVCPKHIPLTEAIGAMSRVVTKQALRDLFGFGYE